MKKLLLILLAIALPLSVGVGTSLYLSPKRITVPSAILNSLSGKSCDWYRDSTGAYHVKSQDEGALYGCVGVRHATDRGWEMDYFRRLVQGRLAEVHGKDKIKSDFMMRLLGLYERALKIEGELDAETYTHLWAYSYGVNRVFHEGASSSYFKTLGYQPDGWRPADTIALIFLQSFDQTRQTFMSELKETERSEQYGEESLANYFEDGTPWDTAILKSGEYQVAQSASARQSVPSMDPRGLHELFDSFDNTETGSNNWALAKSRSTTGHALFSNDPHLSLKTPPFWYWINIESLSWNAMGATFPGVPVVTSGLNQRMAWGLTNAYLKSGRLAFVDEAELKEATTLRPVVSVKWMGLHWPIFFQSFRRTPSGLPILPLPSPKGKALVLNWMGYRLNAQNIRAALHLMKNSTAAEMFKNLEGVGIGSWNFVFADADGDIGYHATGTIVKNRVLTPLGVGEMKLSQLESIPTLSQEEMPQLLKPKRAYIVTANNRQFPKDAALHGGYGYRASFRAYRIEELLTVKSKHDVASMKAIQCDLLSTEARIFVPLLLKAAKSVDLNGEQRDAIDLLSKWDFVENLQCRACSVYRRWVDLVQEGQNLNEAAFYRKLAKNPTPEFITTIFQELQLALISLRSATGESFPEWGRIHRVAFPSHADDPRIDPKGFLPSPSDENVVNPGSSSWNKNHYEHTGGASQRLVVELTSPPKAIFRLAGPNSEFDSMDLKTNPIFQQWADCTYDDVEFPAKWSNPQVIGL